MRRIDIIGFSALAGCVAFASAPANAGAIITGTALISGLIAVSVGNQGNPAIGLVTPLSTPGTFTVAPLTGSGGGNTTQGTMTIDLGVAPSEARIATLPNETGLDVTVAHWPPSTSKWNKIKHRPFAFMRQNRRGKPLVSHQVMVQRMGPARPIRDRKSGAKLTATGTRGAEDGRRRCWHSISNATLSMANGTTQSHRDARLETVGSPQTRGDSSRGSLTQGHPDAFLISSVRRQQNH